MGGVDLNDVYKRCEKAKSGWRIKVEGRWIGESGNHRIGVGNGDFSAVGNIIEKGTKLSQRSGEMAQFGT